MGVPTQRKTWKQPWMHYEKWEGSNQSQQRISVSWAVTDQYQCKHLICEREQDQDNLFLSQVIYRYLITVILTVKLW